ncbi:unnamed protein product [Cyprideis torosa]|uniref:Uncharacterized protein n=1 Tax=Cyprideis torosa TaxID=163714 RepID=A0A7R8WQ85_9CRUS|nr:unnamed protein product [Cyprideis torosa]CAG0905758.1 unnamed protein product [Cyprideis torosa]
MAALENFEALLALTNLAQMSESVRQRIIKEGGLGKIENYMYEDHEDLHRAAIQAVVNLCMSPDTVKAFEGENDRLKYFILICNEEEEPEVTQAVAGALAFLTSSSEKICNKFLTIPKWMEAMSFLLANPSEPVRERGACIAAFLMDSNKENAAKIVETPILELLMALTSKEVTSEYRPGEKVVKYAHEALMSAKEHGVIQENKAEDDA